MKLAQAMVVLAAMALGVGPAYSQLSVYGDFTAAHINPAAGQTYLYGPAVGLQAALAPKHGLVVSGDLRASFLYGSGQQFQTLAVGPRVAFQVKKFTPYFEGLVGFGRYNDGKNTRTSATTDALIEGNVGIDRRITKRIEWRVIDAGYEQFFALGNRFHPITFATGVVFHLGS